MIEIEQETLQNRVDNFWNNGNLVALQYGREDLVLSLEERIVQARLEILEDLFLEEGSNIIDWSETGNLEGIKKEMDDIKKSEQYKSGESRMSRLVEEVLKK